MTRQLITLILCYELITHFNNVYSSSEGLKEIFFTSDSYTNFIVRGWLLADQRNSHISQDEFCINKDVALHYGGVVILRDKKIRNEDIREMSK